MADFYIKKGDDEPALERVLEGVNGNPANLTGATVRFLMKRVGASTPKVDAECEIVEDPEADPPITPEDGTVSYAWTGTDTDTAGEYDAEFEVTYAGGEQETFPSDSYLRIRVTRDLG